jgi:hypothetical protein
MGGGTSLNASRDCFRPTFDHAFPLVQYWGQAIAEVLSCGLQALTPSPETEVSRGMSFVDEISWKALAVPITRRQIRLFHCIAPKI